MSTNNSAKVNANSVNRRTGPSTSNSTTGTPLNRGDSVTVYEKQLNTTDNYYWYRISSSSQQWVRGDFLAPSSGSTGGGGTPTIGVGFDAYVVGDYVNLRSGPGTSYTITGEWRFPSIITVHTFTGVGDTNAQQQWLVIENSAGTLWYVKASFVGSSQLSNFSKVKVTSSSLNVREGPSTSTSVITTLAQNAIVAVLEITPDQSWFRVITTKGVGWVDSTYVEWQ